MLLKSILGKYYFGIKSRSLFFKYSTNICLAYQSVTNLLLNSIFIPNPRPKRVPFLFASLQDFIFHQIDFSTMTTWFFRSFHDAATKTPFAHYAYLKGLPSPRKVSFSLKSSLPISNHFKPNKIISFGWIFQTKNNDFFLQQLECSRFVTGCSLSIFFPTVFWFRSLHACDVGIFSGRSENWHFRGWFVFWEVIIRLYWREAWRALNNNFLWDFFNGSDFVLGGHKNRGQTPTGLRELGQDTQGDSGVEDDQTPAHHQALSG